MKERKRVMKIAREGAGVKVRIEVRNRLVIYSFWQDLLEDVSNTENKLFLSYFSF